jgi:hypothetical protein
MPERAEMWIKCGMISKAGEEALKAKDRNMLEDLRTNRATTERSMICCSSCIVVQPW